MSLASLLRAPAAARAAKTFDRSLFRRAVPTAAASVRDRRLIAPYRARLEATRELLVLDRLSSVVADPDPARAAQGAKCLVLRPDVEPDGVCVAFSPFPVPALGAAARG